MRQISILGSLLNKADTRFAEKWQANLRRSGRMLPWKTLKLYVAKHAISCLFVRCITES